MNSEKVKEIKEKLQEEIFIANSFGDKLRKVPTKELENLLTLINELESENDTLHTNLCEWRKENQQLKDRIAELEKEIKENAFYSKGYAQGIKNTYEVVVPDKLKQFAERLKDKAIRRQEFIGELAIDDIKYVNVKSIDETLKEYVK